MIDAFHLPDLRRRILLTLGILVAFRFVAHVPLPGVDVNALRKLLKVTLYWVCWICLVVVP
jgi:preprotein translocase subunit SecY